MPPSSWPSNTRTMRGVVLGTMRYMSPEQARGAAVDARSDIWSLGVVLYEMLSGRVPFDGETPEAVQSAILAHEAPALQISAAPAPPALSEIIDECLQKDPAGRIQTSQELLARLRATAPRMRRPRAAWRMAAAVALACLLLALLAIGVSRSRQGASQANEPKSSASGNFALTKPTGVAVDPGGAIYVADFPNHTICQVLPDGTLKDFVGLRGTTGTSDGVGTAARFSNPADIAIGPDGNIYVADCDNSSIRKVTPAGVVSTLAGQPRQIGYQDGPAASARFRYPTAIAIDRGGNIYVADIGNHAIRKITPDGIVSTLAGVPGEPGSDDGPGASAHFNQVHGVTVDRTGNVYAADFGNHTIRKITPDGLVTTIAGQAGNPGSNDGVGTNARFCAPYGVAADENGNVFVADTSNHTIRKITPDGVVTTLAGLAGNVGNQDGPGEMAARFAIPAAVAIDRAGDVFVADFGNYAVRKIAPNGMVSTIAARTSPPNESTVKSIAVLPFADLSPEHDQQYFSDGMAEEILNALAQVKDLKVAGRSSSFSFRGQNSDVRRIGATLGVAHILEGSVRKQDNRVRITAQLIQVSDGFHLWSQTYDGDLRDVFSLQERIAWAITNQLKVVLQGEQKARLVKAATSSTAAYALFLQATAIFNRRDSARFPDAIAQLQEALRLDPAFARAHARLASIVSIAPGYDVPLREDPAELVQREAQAAMTLDPLLAEPHAAVGQLLFTQRRYGEARAAYERALTIDPDDSIASFWLGTLLCSTGQSKSSAAIFDKLLARDPMLPNALLWRGWVHLQLGAIDDAERSIRRAADAGLTAVGLGFAHVAQARGEKAGVTEWLVRGFEPFMRDLPAETIQVIAAGIMGGAAERAQALAAIDAYLATQPPLISGGVPLALVWLGEPARALAVAQDKPTRNDTLLFASLWTGAGRSARTLPQFGAFARRSGLAEFWNASGPPDPCRKETSGDYVCD